MKRPKVDEVSTDTAGNSELTYDSTTGQYTYVWKTDKEIIKKVGNLPTFL
ncbi:PxKF domain-containing protein [Clostridium estertheticum]|nr:PxKF domain-containing protein [Clostridium estertheticum]